VKSINEQVNWVQPTTPTPKKTALGNMFGYHCFSSGPH